MLYLYTNTYYKLLNKKIQYLQISIKKRPNASFVALIVLYTPYKCQLSHFIRFASSQLQS